MVFLMFFLFDHLQRCQQAEMIRRKQIVGQSSIVVESNRLIGEATNVDGAQRVARTARQQHTIEPHASRLDVEEHVLNQRVSLRIPTFVESES
jgi:hypothetical protein